MAGFEAGDLSQMKNPDDLADAEMVVGMNPSVKSNAAG